MKGNVLVIGNSGVGKSTLINAVLGDEQAKTGYGSEGTTKSLHIYTNDEVPFNLIDSVGFEPSLLKRLQAIQAVKKWSRSSAKEENKQINLIYFCIDGTSSKLFKETIDHMIKAVSIYKSVPIIVVITKSYSMIDRNNNIKMVEDAFNKHKKVKDRLKKIIPVVASTYVISDELFVAPSGIDELITITNELLPSGIQAASNDINAYKIKRTRALAQSIVATATTSAAIVGAIPIPFADTMILTPIEMLEINTLANLYGIKKNDDFNKVLNQIVEIGTVSLVAKNTLSAIKAIPGINIAASVLNAIVAGVFVCVIGESCAYIFEQIHLGNKKITDNEWIKKFVEDKLATEVINYINIVLTGLSNKEDIKEIAKKLYKLIKKKK